MISAFFLFKNIKMVNIPKWTGRSWVFSLVFPNMVIVIIRSFLPTFYYTQTAGLGIIFPTRQSAVLMAKKSGHLLKLPVECLIDRYVY